MQQFTGSASELPKRKLKQQKEKTASSVTLTTERLVLRSLHKSDAKRVAQICAQPEILDWLPALPRPYKLRDASRWIRHGLLYEEQGLTKTFAVLKQDKTKGSDVKNAEVMGVVGFTFCEHDRTVEMGYWMDPEQRSQGLMYEACQAAVAWMFDFCDIDSVLAGVLPHNLASIRIQEKLGLSLEGERLDYGYEGQPYRILLRRLSRDHYEHEKLVQGSCWAARPYTINQKKVFVVCGALVDDQGRVLLAQRPKGSHLEGLWELPGGKVEGEESPEQALGRELHEELGIVSRSACLAPLTFTTYHYPNFQLVMLVYVLRQWQQTPYAREGQKLAWVFPSQFRDYEVPKANREVMALLRDFL